MNNAIDLTMGDKRFSWRAARQCRRQTGTNHRQFKFTTYCHHTICYLPLLGLTPWDACPYPPGSLPHTLFSHTFPPHPMVTSTHHRDCPTLHPFLPWQFSPLVLPHPLPNRHSWALTHTTCATTHIKFKTFNAGITRAQIRSGLGGLHGGRTLPAAGGCWRVLRAFQTPHLTRLLNFAAGASIPPPITVGTRAALLTPLRPPRVASGLPRCSTPAHTGCPINTTVHFCGGSIAGNRGCSLPSNN